MAEKKSNLVTAEFNLEELKDFRNHFQFLNDRDDFEIKF